MMIKRRQRKPWTDEERILLFDLFLQMQITEISDSNYKIQNLARRLDRTPTSVFMQMQPYAKIDTEGEYFDYVETKYLEPFYNKYINNRELLAKDVERIKKEYESRGVSFEEVEEERNSLESIKSKYNLRDIDFDSLREFARKQNYGLFPHQKEAREKIYDLWSLGYKSVMLQMPTGTGKTRVFSSIVKDLYEYLIAPGSSRKVKRDFNILIFAHRSEIIDQIENTLQETFRIPVGRIQSKFREYSSRNVQVASKDTLNHRLKKWEGNSFDFIIIDEAHHSEAKTYQKILNAFPNARVLGVTATPYRLSHEKFSNTFDRLILSDPISEFIKKEILCDYEYYSIKPNSYLQRQIKSLHVGKDGDYIEEELEEKLNNAQIRASVLETYEKYAKGKKGIVYTISQKHNKALCEEFLSHNHKAVTIDSKTDSNERERLVEQFKEGQIQIICNVDIFSEGFDCPDIEFIQFARPTRSLAKYLQQAGRGLRKDFDRPSNVVTFLDNVGHANKFGLPSFIWDWEEHFNGKIEGNIEFGKSDGIHREKPIDVNTIEEGTIEEGDEEIAKIYETIPERDEMSLSAVVERKDWDLYEVMSFFSKKGVDLFPNSVLSQEQYEILVNEFPKDMEYEEELSQSYENKDEEIATLKKEVTDLKTQMFEMESQMLEMKELLIKILNK